MKPLATLNRPTLKTVDTATKEEAVSFKERTDVTAVPALGVVAETMVALVLADEATRKFGGDSLDELRRNRDAFVANVGLSAMARPRGARGPDGLRARRPSAGGSRRGWTDRSSTPTRRSKREPAARSPRSSRPTARTAFRDLEAEVLAWLLAAPRRRR